MVRFASTYREIEVTSTTALAAPRNSRWHTVARVTLAGPITILLSAMTFAGMPLWLPRGAAGIDHIILPLILLPAVWAILFFHAVLDRSLARWIRRPRHRSREYGDARFSFRIAAGRVHLAGSQAMIRLPQRETKLMVAVHGWLGVVLGLLLYAVIVTGTAAVFAQEIKLWAAGLLGPSDPFARPLEPRAPARAETPEEYRDDLSIRRTGAGNLRLLFP